MDEITRDTEPERLTCEPEPMPAQEVGRIVGQVEARRTALVEQEGLPYGLAAAVAGAEVNYRHNSGDIMSLAVTRKGESVPVAWIQNLKRINRPEPANG